jgi:aldose 1-epimerase
MNVNSPILLRFAMIFNLTQMRNIFISVLVMGLTILLLTGCSGSSNKSGSDTIDSLKLSIMKQNFGTVDGKPVYLFTMKNKNGITIRITNYGGIITSILVPDKNGKIGDIVLGYDSLKGYLEATPYFGAIVGRYANRIAKGRFTLDGKIYKLAINNGNNTLHGGIKGFDKVVWDASESSDTAGSSLILTYLSKDGEEGYPGNLSVKVTYTLTNYDEFRTLIEATTDKATPVNLCNHSYFNLAECDTSILGHILTINADRFTVVNDELIPTGELRPVAGGPMDFTKPHVIGKRIDKVPGAPPGGYDHNYVLLKKQGELSQAAILVDVKTGRRLEIFTTQPGVQFYSGNFLDGTITGKEAKKYYQHWGLCLETQHFPDSPNQATFPGTILKPGEKYSETTLYKFGVLK